MVNIVKKNHDYSNNKGKSGKIRKNRKSTTSHNLVITTMVFRIFGDDQILVVIILNYFLEFSFNIL